MSKYIEPKYIADRILSALGISAEDDGSYFVTLRNKLSYYNLTPENCEILIDEVVGDSCIDWFDDNQTCGDIEINGTLVEIRYS